MLPTLRRSSSARSGICEPSTDHETGRQVRHAAVLTRRWRGAGWLTETGWCCGWSECGWSGTQDAAGAPPEPAAAGWSRRSTARVRTGGTIFETGPDDDSSASVSRNRLVWGDNLHVLATLADGLAGPPQARLAWCNTRDKTQVHT